MTSGSPLYLVSACSSAEEFVAAFRRYADRTGLFVPAAAPLPAGRKGRIALTLKNGGVMIEGEAEILQSSAKPTVLYGRPGMTVKFVETDEPSKLMIVELEKARLAMKPAPTSATPRPASIPAEPRPVVPPTGGRIDAANSLAECVVIGDVSSLEVTAGPARPGGFVVPSIPSVGAPRPKTPSSSGATPVSAVPSVPAIPAQAPEAKRPTPASLPNPNHKMTSIGFPAIDKLPAQTESGKVRAATTLGLPALDRAPAPPKDDLLTTMRGNAPVPPNKTPVQPIPAQNPLLETQMGTGVPRPAAKSPPRVTEHDETTTLGERPPTKPAAPPIHEEPTTLGGAPPKKPMQQVPNGSSEPGTPPPRRHDPKHKATSIGFPAMRAPFETQSVAVVPPPKNDPSEPILAKSTKPPPSRSKAPTTPPLTPRHPTPITPLPLVRPPSVPANPPVSRPPSVNAEEEKTDLSTVPMAALPPTDSGPVYVSGSLPEEVPVEQVDSLVPTLTSTRSGGLRASEIMAAVAPNEDWTMSPDASGPTVMPSGKPEPKVEASEPTPAPQAPPGPPTGDWTISLDPEQGWSAPAKVEPLPVAPSVIAGNPDRVVASDKALSVVQWEEKPTGIGEAKIEIDPTLMEPLRPMPALDNDASPPRAAPPPLAPMPPMPPPPSGMFGAAAQVPAPAFATPRMSPPVPTFDHLPSNVDPLETYNIHGAVAASKRKRTLVIAISAAVAVIAGFVLVLVLASGKSKPKTTPAGGGSAGSAEIVKSGSSAALTTPGSAAVPQVAGSAAEVAPPSGSNVEEGSGSAEQAVATTGSAGSAATPSEATAPVASGPCKVTISSLPPGADVLLDSNKLGTTPGTFELPCGTESKLTLKKTRFLSTPRTIKPSSTKTNKVLVKLNKQTFQVKVTSTPAGATITAGGRSMGVTPTTIRLPGYEPTAITLTKPGYSKDVGRVTPKGNNTSHHVVLKKGR
ncbi:MAG: PEGA domain-containing protein [Kofleriaceae bacterium]|nr:PEGA domain-containing protein [Kofleriaceae bacterium]